MRKCSQCGKRFIFLSSLRIHEQVAHSASRPRLRSDYASPARVEPDDNRPAFVSPFIPSLDSTSSQSSSSYEGGGGSFAGGGASGSWGSDSGSSSSGADFSNVSSGSDSTASSGD